MSENIVIIEKEKEKILRSIGEAATELGIEWFICGAGARILLCENMYGMRAGRATLDLDFAVRVNTFAQYQTLRNLLCDQHDFDPDPHQAQRLCHSNGYKVDIVPFGRIGEPDKKVIWEGKEDRTMNIIGFDEAYSSAIKIRVNNEFTILVPNYALLFGLKLIAWAERHVFKGTEDARDIAYFLRNSDEFYSKYLYDKYATLLESVDYDFELAVAFVLGRNVQSSFYANTVEELKAIIENELADPFYSTLVQQVSKDVHATDPEERATALLSQVLSGLISASS